MAKSITLADIAARVGVSNVAVSKALSGKPGVSDELRIKIKQIADEMGYVSNTALKSASVETGNIGVVIPENYYGYSTSFYGQLYERVVRALFENKYYGILEILSKDDEKNGKLPNVMLDGKVDGLIFLGQLDRDYIEKMVKQTELPVFFLDTYVPTVDFDTVISDGYYGMYMMTRYLIDQGHRRIGFVGNVDSTSSIMDRFWGYRKALREAGIAFLPEWEISDREKEGRAYERLELPEEILDAYACNCDLVAHRLIQTLEENGYAVPQQVSVVGFDNFLPMGTAMDDRITSYEVNMKRMAETCVKSLIRKMKHKKYVSGIQIVTGKVVLKKSVMPRI
ncbi:MAG: substrate-binding domain-containing protein [Lachnospiraceae bacterium]|nr:substrate-binding domain-containing protein [Lachnospiraceae bacterium]